MTKQNKWDCFLITSFYKRPDVPMWKLVEIYNQSLDGLVRTPVESWHMKATVMTFICKFMKKLSITLWGHELTNAYDIAITLPDNYILTASSVRQLTREEQKELKKSKEEYRESAISRTAIREFKDKNSHRRHIAGHIR